MGWKLTGCPIFYLAVFFPWVWYRCPYPFNCPGTVIEVPGMLTSYFLCVNEAAPHTFTLLCMTSFPQINCPANMMCNFSSRVGSVPAASGSWQLGTKEEFCGCHHLDDYVTLKTQSQHVHSGPFSTPKPALSQISVPYLQTLVTQSLFCDCPQTFSTYTLFLLPSSLLLLFISIHSLSYNHHCYSPELC